MRNLAILLLLAVVLGACQEPDLVRSPGSAASSPGPEKRGAKAETGGERKTPSGDEGESAGEKPGPQAPPPGTPLPKDPAAIARELTEAHRALDSLVEAALKMDGDTEGPEEEEMELWALLQQQLYRTLGKDPELGRRVLRRLPRDVRDAASANVGAQSDLYRLNEPVEPPIKLPRTRPEPASQLLAYYKAADERFGVPWYVLASVNFIETRFGRLKGPSSAGALGPMQFLPSTWDQYGNGGDIMDPRDAILGAARYLSASGAPGDMRGALFAYNNSDLYVNAILDYAQQMKDDPRDYYAYYHWQVFVRTTKGDVQLTGPGRD